MPNKKKNKSRPRPKPNAQNGALPKAPYPGLPLCFHPGPIVNRQLLNYVHKGALTEGAAGAGTYYQFRINDIYDPDFSGVGLSAMGYSSWNTFYTRYKVLKTRVRVEMVNNNGNAGVVGCFPHAGSGSFTSNPTYWATQPFARSKLIEGYANGGPNSKAIFDFRVDHAKVFGVTKSQYFNDQDYGSSFGSSPARATYLTCFMQGYGGTGGVAYLRVILSFDVELSQPTHTIVN